MFTNHIGLKVKDIEYCKSFYCENFDFKIHHEYEDERIKLTFLENENSIIELIYTKEKDYNYVQNGIVEHIAFTVDNIDLYKEKLMKNNVKCISKEFKEVDNKKIFFIEGPSGEKLELVEHIRK
ncbi:VOC family protein [Clostridium ihumii]|uniref:VOC family protein n=1 Tax=Clostridium ihumii TaxID=1470356 RepID=UPI0005916B4F|nr:VOC family protein [Clostridium ihumii]